MSNQSTTTLYPTGNPYIAEEGASRYTPTMFRAATLTAPTMTLRELAEWYFTYYAPNNLKEVTIYNYRYMADRFLLPDLGDLPLPAFNNMLLTEYFSRLPVTPTYCRSIFIVLRSLFTVAVQNGLLDRHPCDHVILPRKPIDAAEHRPLLTEAQAQELFQMTDEYSWFTVVIRFLLLTGMRSGEAFALQWEDIDFETETISIRRNLANVASRHWLSTPKTRNSIRQIFMSAEVRELLLRQRAEQAVLFRELEAAGKPAPHPEMVFTSARGNYIDHNYTERKFKKFIAHTSFSDITLHSLRHANATFMLAGGVDLKVVSAMLGHSSIAITANTYTDVLDRSKLTAAQVVAEQLTQRDRTA